MLTRLFMQWIENSLTGLNFHISLWVLWWRAIHKSIDNNNETSAISNVIMMQCTQGTRYLRVNADIQIWIERKKKKTKTKINLNSAVGMAWRWKRPCACIKLAARPFMVIRSRSLRWQVNLTESFELSDHSKLFVQEIIN